MMRLWAYALISLALLGSISVGAADVRAGPAPSSDSSSHTPSNRIASTHTPSIDAPSTDISGRYEPRPYVAFDNAEWSRNAVIYQLNTRQFTKQGTFLAAQGHLPRLAEMGVDIIWLMPIHPIGEVNRKGELGSPYAVQDYRAINPDLGTEEEFRTFVKAAHALGLKVILDWVANHTAWDNPLTQQHLSWYRRTPEGALMPPLGTDWSDVVALDYSQAGLRQYMTESLLYWVREYDIDGYRADVAGFVPLDFWETARGKLQAEKPVFMLAEWETRDLHRHAFDASYAWGWKEAMQEVAKGAQAGENAEMGGGAGKIRSYYINQHNTWPADAYRMNYTDNHDQNSWDGVASEIYGPTYEAAIALSFVGSGIPLIYNGQEADLSHQLRFFEKDEIIWRDGRYGDLFRKLIKLKTQQRALWNGRYGAPMVEVPNNVSDHVFSFIRGEKGQRVFAVFNLSGKAQQVEFEKARHTGSYVDALSDEAQVFDEDHKDSIILKPWDYRIYRESIELDKEANRLR